MVIDLEEFQKTATREQIDILITLGKFSGIEQKICEKINRAVEPMQRQAEEADEMKDGQYAGLIRSDMSDLSILALTRERNELAEIRGNIRDLMISAVKDHGMGDVGIIQRNYEHYVGEPIPTV